MTRKTAILFVLVTGVVAFPLAASAQGDNVIPPWIKNSAEWWADDLIDDGSFVSGLQWLISNGIIVVEQEQAQPSVADNETQKLADEYWGCSMGDPIPSPTCIEYDEDKYTVGGINELTDISHYYASCDTDCSL